MSNNDQPPALDYKAPDRCEVCGDEFVDDAVNVGWAVLCSECAANAGCEDIDSAEGADDLETLAPAQDKAN